MRKMVRMKRVALVTTAAAAALFAGCLEQRVEQVLYLDPQGGVTWSVLQQEVRSDEQDTEKRAAEERAFLARARAGGHRIARAFDSLGALRVDTRVLREERPYAVWTEARLGRVDAVLETFLRTVGVPARAELREEGNLRRLELALRPDAVLPSDEDHPAEALVDEAAAYRFVLTEGRFVEAAGFRLEDDDRVAVMLDPDDEEMERRDGDVVYRLAWSAGDPEPGRKR
jgi:hypothetical protein